MASSTRILSIRRAIDVCWREDIVLNKRRLESGRRRVPMKLNRLFVFAFVLSVGIPSAIAQESVRLQFHVTKDGSSVAKPEMSMTSGSHGRLEIDTVGRLSFTPRVRGSSVAIAFDISSGSKQFQPSLVIGKDEPGSISWTSLTGSESFKLTVSWVR